MSYFCYSLHSIWYDWRLVEKEASNLEMIGGEGVSVYEEKCISIRLWEVKIMPSHYAFITGKCCAQSKQASSLFVHSSCFREVAPNPFSYVFPPLIGADSCFRLLHNQITKNSSNWMYNFSPLIWSFLPRRSSSPPPRRMSPYWEPRLRALHGKWVINSVRWPQKSVCVFFILAWCNELQIILSRKRKKTLLYRFG